MHIEKDMHKEHKEILKSHFKPIKNDVSIAKKLQLKVIIEGAQRTIWC